MGESGYKTVMEFCNWSGVEPKSLGLHADFLVVKQR